MGAVADAFEWFRSGLSMWSSIIIVTIFSFIVIFLDEYVLKPWRQKKWERLAASGDAEAQELLRIARSAKVSEE